MSGIVKIVERIVKQQSGVDRATEDYFDILGKSSAEVLEWAMINLDTKGQAALMDSLGLDGEAASTLRRAFNAARVATV